MRCAIYARYSSDMQKDNSIGDQVRNCRELAKKNGWEVLDGHVYCDRAVSGSTLHGRIQLSRLLDVATTKPQPFEYVLVDDTSRLSRDKIDQFNVIEDFHAAGVHLYFVSQNIDTADEQANDVVLPIHGIVDNLYLKELAKKTQRGMAGQVLKGYSPGGRCYGFVFTPVPDPSGATDRKTGQVKKLGTSIDIDLEQASVIRRIFDLYSSGIGLKEIANLLNRECVSPPGVHNQRKTLKVRPSWCTSAIRYILQNRKYIGDWTWNKHKWYKNRKTGNRKRRLRPQSEWVEYKNPELEIVSEDLFEMAQARFAQNKVKFENGTRGQKSEYLFTGILKCAVCGASYTVVGGGKKGDRPYGCSVNWHRGGSVCPNNARVRRSVLEEALLSAIEEQVCQPEVIAKVVKLANKKMKAMMSEQLKLVPSLKKKIVKLKIEVDNLVSYIASSGDTSPSIQASLSGKETELERLIGNVDRQQSAKNIDFLEVDAIYVSNQMRTLRRLLNTDVTSARATLMKLTENIELSPVSEGKHKYLRAVGKSRLDGVLGLTGGISTTNNSGGPLFAKVSELMPSPRTLVKAI